MDDRVRIHNQRHRDRHENLPIPRNYFLPKFDRTLVLPSLDAREERFSIQKRILSKMNLAWRIDILRNHRERCPAI